jgi:hypothetical protein
MNTQVNSNNTRCSVLCTMSVTIEKWDWSPKRAVGPLWLLPFLWLLLAKCIILHKTLVLVISKLTFWDDKFFSQMRSVRIHSYFLKCDWILALKSLRHVLLHCYVPHSLHGIVPKVPKLHDKHVTFMPKTLNP